MIISLFYYIKLAHQNNDVWQTILYAAYFARELARKVIFKVNYSECGFYTKPGCDNGDFKQDIQYSMRKNVMEKLICSPE